jgi:hypothetical protein
MVYFPLVTIQILLGMTDCHVTIVCYLLPIQLRKASFCTRFWPVPNVRDQKYKKKPFFLNIFTHVAAPFLADEQAHMFDSHYV